MHNRADCSMDGLYVAGQSVAEKGGPDYVHIGRNVGPGPAGPADPLRQSRRSAAVRRRARPGLRVCLTPETVIRPSTGSE